MCYGLLVIVEGAIGVRPSVSLPAIARPVAGAVAIVGLQVAAGEGEQGGEEGEGEAHGVRAAGLAGR